MYPAFEQLPKLLEEVSSVYDILGTNKLWWRGHSSKTWKLVPKVHREYSTGEFYEQWDEFNFVHRFGQQAPIRYPNWPDDRTLQLSLMQHYGLPTRLLDWSLSLFVGLYFAVCNKKRDGEDGSLWAVDPLKLNRNQADHDWVFLTHSSPIQKLINRAFTEAENREPSDQCILAFTAPQVDIRMLVQSSLFTIHENGVPLEDVSGSKGITREIVIRKEDKRFIREALDITGFSREQLFPDLDSLAKELDWLGSR